MKLIAPKYLKAVILAAALLLAVGTLVPVWAQKDGGGATAYGKKTYPHCGQGQREQGSLLGIMCDLGQSMAHLQRALWADRIDLVIVEAEAIANHPRVSSTEKARIQQSLGKRFGTFVVLDKLVHTQAMRISEQAKNGAGNDQLLKDIYVLQQSCLSCHIAFKEKLQTAK